MGFRVPEAPRCPAMQTSRNDSHLQRAKLHQRIPDVLCGDCVHVLGLSDPAS